MQMGSFDSLIQHTTHLVLSMIGLFVLVRRGVKQLRMVLSECEQLADFLPFKKSYT